MPRNLIAFTSRFLGNANDPEKSALRLRAFLATVLFLWILLLLVVGIRGYFSPRKNSVFPAYYQAGQHFAQHRDLYGQQDKTQGIDVFRYSPAFAALMVPLTCLPENAAGALWRVGQGAFLLGSLWFFCRRGLAHAQGTFASLATFRFHDAEGSERCSKKDTLSIALFLLVGFLLSISSLNNAQLNPAITACCLVSVLLAARGLWGSAGCLLAIPVFFKIFPFSLFMLMALAAPLRFGFAFFAVLGGLFLTPFLMAPTDFVLTQYRNWWAFLGNDDRHYWPLEAGYRDLWMVLQVCHLDIPVWAYQIIQASLALLAAVLVLGARVKRGRGEALETALVLGVLWMILCGPSTESSTYTLLGPVLGMLLARAVQPGQRATYRFMAITGALLLLGGVLTGLFPHGGSIQALGIQPLGALCLGVAYLVFLMGSSVKTSTALATDSRMRELQVTRPSRQKAGSIQWRGWLNRHAETPV